MARSRYRLPEKMPTDRQECRKGGVFVFDGYVRVSYVGRRAPPRFTSPQQQEAQIRSYAAAQGYRIGLVHVDLDRSGSDKRRPALQRTLTRIAAGESDGVIVTRLDRFSRSVTDALQMLTVIAAANASLISIEDGLNAKTPFGRALSTVLLALAELESARTAESTETSRRQSTLRGVHRCIYPPTGYRRGPDGRLAPDPNTAPVIAAPFQRRAAGREW